MWMSSHGMSESPYSVKGTIKFTGLEKKPKNIYEQIILSERVKPRIQERLHAMMVVLRKILKVYNLT